MRGECAGPAPIGARHLSGRGRVGSGGTGARAARGDTRHQGRQPGPQSFVRSAGGKLVRSNRDTYLLLVFVRGSKEE